MRIYSFPPFSDSKSRILILGTIPGKDSLKYNQYYAHKRNAFWKIMFALFDEPFSENFEIRKQLLVRKNIALWDVLKSCERETSADSAILNEEPNDLKQFLENNPAIYHIFFNGNNPKKYFSIYFKNITVAYTILPSTSPAHAISMDKKLKEWSIIKKYSSN